MITIKHIVVDDIHTMSAITHGKTFVANSDSYDRCYSHMECYLEDAGVDVEEELLMIYSTEDGQTVLFNADTDVGSMQHKLDSCYDLVDEVVAGMRAKGWEGLAERTHRLYEALYIDAIETFEQEEAIVKASVNG